MGPKKKGKGNKLARMSEEERIRYLQHRAAIEEEAKRRKEQLISTFMKNKLRREEIFSRLNMAKINQQWRQTLRQIKCVELKQDVEDLYKWFDYTKNKKNQLIEMLLVDLQEAESQYSRVHHCHTGTITKLINIHEQRVGFFLAKYKLERNEISRKAKADLKDLTKGYVTDEENLQATLYRVKTACDEKITAMHTKHVSKVDELRNNMLTDLENMKTAREIQIEKLWSNFINVLKQYWEETEDRRRQYIVMRESDYENCKQIFENNHQIEILTETLNNLKDQLVKTQKTSSDRLLQYNKDKEDARQLLFTVKGNLTTEIENDNKKLICLNTASCKTSDELKRILSKGEQILKLQSLCRKLETLNEKVCLDGIDKPQLTKDEEKEIQDQTKEFSDSLAEKTYNALLKLDLLWKRHNRVLLEKEALQLHYESLQSEQKQLKSTLRNYLSDMAVRKPESKVSYANGVQIDQERPSSYVPTRRKSAHSTITYIEATQSPSIRQFINAQMMK